MSTEAEKIADLCHRFYEDIRITKGEFNSVAPSTTELTIDLDRVPELVRATANAVAQFRSGREYDSWDAVKLSNRDLVDAVNLLGDIGKQLERGGESS